MNINFLDLSTLMPQCPTREQLQELYDKFVIPEDQITHEDFICSVAKYKHKKNIAANKITSLCDNYKTTTFIVYKLHLEDELVYIGSSISLESRIVKHLEDKRFNFVELCLTKDKEAMLALEHKLIVENAPKHNKDCNLRLANNYCGVLSEEKFIPLEDYQYTKKISKSFSRQISSLFTSKIPKYKRDFINGMWFIVSDLENTGYLTKEARVVGKDKGYEYKPKKQKNLCSWRDLLEKEGMLKHLKTHPKTGIHTFYETFVVASSKYRYKGSNKWYRIGDMNELVLKMVSHVKDEENKCRRNIAGVSTPTFWFGKYKGLSLETVMKMDAQYITWCLDNLKQAQLIKLNMV